MNGANNINEITFKNLKNTYSSLANFHYNSTNNSISYNNQEVYLNNYPLQNIDPNFFRMKPDDIILYLLYRLYIPARIQDIKQNLVQFNNKFINEFNIRYIIYSRNKKLLDTLSDNNPNIQNFTRYLIECYRILKQNNITLNQMSNQNDNFNNQSNANTNSQSLSNSLERGVSRARTKPGWNGKYEDFVPGDENNIGMAGFTSILLIITTIIITGISLAYLLLK